jgi:hypothetical protein
VVVVGGVRTSCSEARYRFAGSIHVRRRRESPQSRRFQAAVQVNENTPDVALPSVWWSCDRFECERMQLRSDRNPGSEVVEVGLWPAPLTVHWGSKCSSHIARSFWKDPRLPLWTGFRRHAEGSGVFAIAGGRLTSRRASAPRRFSARGLRARICSQCSLNDELLQPLFLNLHHYRLLPFRLPHRPRAVVRRPLPHSAFRLCCRSYSPLFI